MYRFDLSLFSRQNEKKKEISLKQDEEKGNSKKEGKMRLLNSKLKFFFLQKLDSIMTRLENLSR